MVGIDQFGRKVACGLWAFVAAHVVDGQLVAVHENFRGLRGDHVSERVERSTVSRVPDECVTQFSRQDVQEVVFHLLVTRAGPTCAVVLRHGIFEFRHPHLDCFETADGFRVEHLHFPA